MESPKLYDLTTLQREANRYYGFTAQQTLEYLNGRGRGDQYVIVDVEIPKKVTRAQREALKAFEDSMKEDNYEKRKGFFKNLRDRFS